MAAAGGAALVRLKLSRRGFCFAGWGLCRRCHLREPEASVRLCAAHTLAYSSRASNALINKRMCVCLGVESRI